MPQIKQIDHVALVVDDLEGSLAFWRDALGLPLSALRDVPEESSQVAFLSVPGGEIELVRPTEAGSGIARYLEKRGAGMHHICLQVDDLAGMLAQLKARGVRLINEEARRASDGRQYAFVHPQSTSGVLLELYQA